MPSRWGRWRIMLRTIAVMRSPQISQYRCFFQNSRKNSARQSPMRKVLRLISKQNSASMLINWRRGNFATQSYHDFIGFDVSKDLLERAFHQTYSLSLSDVFSNLDLAIGSYRKTVSDLIPKMTRVAWQN